MIDKTAFPNFLAKPTQRALANLGIQKLEKLANYKETEIENLHGIGKNALEKIKISLEKNGLKFSDK